MHTNYLKKIALFLFLFALPIGGNWLFLYNSGELLSVEDLAKNHYTHNVNGRVGLATRHLGYDYKKAMYQHMKPAVLVIGSSRVMQFKKEFFADPFFNVGGAMNNLNEGFSFLQEAFQVHVPEVVIIGLDYWWFNDKAIKPTLEIKPPKRASHRISLRSYLLPYKWLYEKKITPTQYAQRLNPWGLFRPDWSKGIGVDGILNNNGFASDGSYAYTKTATGKETSIDEKFHQSLSRLQSGGDRFEYGQQVNEQHFEQLLNMVNFIENQGAKVVLFIPPLAPTVVNQMHALQDEFRFIDDLRLKLKTADLDFADFHDGNQLGSDCEFIDGIHGGDITFAKILLEIGKRDHAFENYVNIVYLQRMTREYENFAMIPSAFTTEKEVDFLKIGCVKISQS
jgi:hypothetical protein